MIKHPEGTKVMLHINKHYIEEIFFKFLKLYFINNDSLLTIGSG